MSTKQPGLGAADPFNRRREAASAFIQPRNDDAGQSTSGQVASNKASNSASISESDPEKGTDVVTSTAAAAELQEPAPPPPGKEPEPRTQMNVRILADRDRILRRYQRQHGTTRQAVVDQMVDEYLHRRGLLPD